MGQSSVQICGVNGSILDANQHLCNQAIRADGG